MRTPENVILSALRNGGRIKSFYRRSVQGPPSTKTQLSDGYVLELPGEHGEVILGYADFLSVKMKLSEIDTWEQIIGNVLFGGSSWVICCDIEN
ncbi:cytoplasmic protein [Serratia ureilytica]|uniref:cytoplasmic protein n=1 Tax=Serratia ureilytica TaxID=300181 RepID=UPI001AA0E199|nr:cytoplasmic protein [Serratia ureilytica]MBO1811517.1 cytoplasmic protein [Serratia ureilytica]